ILVILQVTQSLVFSSGYMVSMMWQHRELWVIHEIRGAQQISTATRAPHTHTHPHTPHTHTHTTWQSPTKQHRFTHVQMSTPAACWQLQATCVTLLPLPLGS